MLQIKLHIALKLAPLGGLTLRENSAHRWLGLQKMQREQLYETELVKMQRTVLALTARVQPQLATFATARVRRLFAVTYLART